MLRVPYGGKGYLRETTDENEVHEDMATTWLWFDVIAATRFSAAPVLPRCLQPSGSTLMGPFQFSKPQTDVFAPLFL